MKITPRADAVLLTVVLITVLVAFVTPKTAHPLVSALGYVVHHFAGPVPTVAAAEPTAFVVAETCTFDNPTPAACLDTNPVNLSKNEIAVIDSVSATCTTNEGSQLLFIELTTTNQLGSIVTNTIPVLAPAIADQRIMGIPSRNTVGMNFTTYAYGGPDGSTITADAYASFGQKANPQGTIFGCNVTVSGHTSRRAPWN